MSLVGLPYYHDTVGGTVIEVRGHPVIVAFGVIQNPTGSQAYLQVFNKRAANVVLGTTVPDYVQPVSPGDNDPVQGGLLMMDALSIACTTTATGSIAAICKVALGLS
jgi:hypothetical protein